MKTKTKIDLSNCTNITQLTISEETNPELVQLFARQIQSINARAKNEEKNREERAKKKEDSKEYQENLTIYEKRIKRETENFNPETWFPNSKPVKKDAKKDVNKNVKK